MKIIVCKKCGANDFSEHENHRVCNYCRTTYIIEQDEKKPKKIVIDVLDDITRLLNKCKDDPKNARKYANLILDIDPCNEQALKYL